MITHPSRGNEAAFAPTFVDRQLERLQRAAPELTRLSDGIVVLFTAMLAMLDLLTAVSWSSGDWLLGLLPAPLATVAIGGLAIIAVAVRRSRLPLAMVTLALVSLGVTSGAWLVGVTMAPSFAALFAFALLAARALRVEPGGAAVVLTVAGGVGVVSEIARVGPSSFPTLVVISGACYAVAVFGGLYLRWSDWRRVVGEASARTDERLEIARELHDLVGHYVTGIVVQAQAAQHVATAHPEVAVEALARIESAGGDAMTALRRMVGGLRDDSPTAPGAGWDDLEDLVAAAAADGMPVRLQLDPEVRNAPADLSSSVHRIVAESLTNVRRHAREVTRVQVDVERRLDRLTVRVHDDGRDGTVTPHDTYGLVGMRERADALGGALYAGPGPAGGWLVFAELPLDGPA